MFYKDNSLKYSELFSKKNEFTTGKTSCDYSKNHFTFLLKKIKD